jgi:hypothetical protein
MAGGHSVDRQASQPPLEDMRWRSRPPSPQLERTRQATPTAVGAARSAGVGAAAGATPSRTAPGETAPLPAGPFPWSARPETSLPSPAPAMRKLLPPPRRRLTPLGPSCPRQRSRVDETGGSRWHSGQLIQPHGPAPRARGRAPVPAAGVAAGAAGAAAEPAPGPGRAAAEHNPLRSVPGDGPARGRLHVCRRERLRGRPPVNLPAALR